MKKTDKNLMMCIAVFCIGLVISNVVTGKLIDIPINLFGHHIQLPGAAHCYMLTFLMTDVIGEIWGKKEANQCVRYGLICQVIATFLIVLTQFLPAVDPEMQVHYEALLGQNWIFVVGSLVAYFCSQSWDVFFFHKIRDKFVAKNPDNRKYRWIWNNLSTMTSQIIDTVIFIGIAFGIGFKWLWTPGMLPVLGGMIVGQYLLKFLLALADTPFFYLLTRKKVEE